MKPLPCKGFTVSGLYQQETQNIVLMGNKIGRNMTLSVFMLIKDTVLPL